MKRSLLIAIPTTLLLVVSITVLERDLPVDDLLDQYAPPPSRFVRVGDLNVHVRDEGLGTPLVLLHGTGSSLHTWDAWTAMLHDSIRVVRFDLPGFGLTGPRSDRDYSIGAFVDFVGATLDTLGLDRVDLGGNSLGGHIAWAFAARYPDRVDRLVLLDPSGAVSRPPDAFVFRLARWPIVGKLISWLDPAPFVRMSLEDVYARDDLVTDDLVKRHRDLSLRAGNRTAFVDRARAIASDLPIRGVAASTLLMWGEADPWIPVLDAEIFASAIRDIRVVTYPNVGHVPMEEIPGITASETRRFLLRRTMP